MSEQPVRRVSRFIRNHPWALEEDKLDAICEVVDARMRGITLSEAEIQARIGAGPMRARDTSIVNAVAVVPLQGVVCRRMNMMAAISGGTSTEQFVAALQQAISDPGVKAVVVDCDSPGGTVDGLIEAADRELMFNAKVSGKNCLRLVGEDADDEDRDAGEDDNALDQ